MAATRALAAFALPAAVALLVGCSSGGNLPATERPNDGGRSLDAGHRAEGHKGKRRLKPSRCRPGAGNCRAASGRVLYVEAVDPDGDGDAHFVLASDESVTGPGLTVIDVERSMRPRRLPRAGDRVSAAGPVYRGSHGQRQIEATELHIARGG